MGIEITVNMNKGGKPEMDDEYEDMAEEGRNGDDVMGHLTRGEIVIPVNLAEKLGPMLAEKFAEMDMDINQYIVGNPKNSINPETKCPEFGLKKAFKSTVKAIGGAVNSVLGVVGLDQKPKGPSPEEVAAEEAAIKKLKDEEDAFKKQTAETDAQARALATQMEQEKVAASQQTTRIRKESEGIQRETDERRAARLRARKRTGGRPMLSRGVSLKSEA